MPVSMRSSPNWVGGFIDPISLMVIVVLAFAVIKCTSTVAKSPSGPVDSLKSVGLVPGQQKQLEAVIEPLRVAPGAVVTTERTRTITHNIILDEKTLNEVRVSSTLLEFLKGEIHSKSEKHMGVSLSTNETVKRLVTVDGRVAQKWKIVWRDRLQTGIARCVANNGKTFDIPYTIQISTDLDALQDK